MIRVSRAVRVEGRRGCRDPCPWTSHGDVQDFFRAKFCHAHFRELLVFFAFIPAIDLLLAGWIPAKIERFVWIIGILCAELLHMSPMEVDKKYHCDQNWNAKPMSAVASQILKMSL